MPEKSTTISIICGQLQKDSGTVLTKLIVSYQELFRDYEVVKGGMDDVLRRWKRKVFRMRWLRENFQIHRKIIDEIPFL